MTREKAIEYLEWVRPKKPYTLDKKNVQTAIDMSIEALKEQRPSGEWIDYQDEKYSYLANCSKCGYQMDTHEEHGYFNFCPNCGADMREEGEAE